MNQTLLLAQDAVAQSGAAVPENIAFAIIAAIMLIAAFKMVTTGNVVHAALYLVIVLAGSAAIFLLLGSDFVGATQILVYIGAIIVLFLFGIMLTKAQLGDDDSVDQEQRGMGALVGGLLFVVMAFALVETFGNDKIEFTNPEPVLLEEATVDAGDLPTPVLEALNISSDAGQVEITAAEFDALDPEVQRRVPGAQVYGNSRQIANATFSQYIIPFEAVSVLLLAALIGAVVLARKE